MSDTARRGFFRNQILLVRLRVFPSVFSAEDMVGKIGAEEKGTIIYA